MTPTPRLSLTVLAACVLAGCTTPSALDGTTQLRKDATLVAEARATAPAVTSEATRVLETPGAYIPVVARKGVESPWLRSQVVDIQVGNGPVPLSEVLRTLSRQGVTVTSELPLERYAYSGFSLNGIDAESALRAIVSSVGLDFQVDNVRRIVIVKPLSSRTWYLNIGNRRSTYASGTAGGGSGSSIGAAAGALPGSSATGSSGGAGGGSTSTQSTGASTISSADDFWASLRTELDSRMKVMLPEPPKPVQQPAATTLSMPLTLPPMIPPVPGTAGPAQAGAQAANGAAPAAAAPQQSAAGQPPALVPQPGMVASQVAGVPLQVAPKPQTMSSEGLNYVSKKVGDYAVNPETGAVTVQAPHWVLSELDSYFKRVQEMYNTDIVFNGELVMLTTDAQRSEGLDISAFARFASSRYGLAFSNNALGGVTLSFPSGSFVPSVAVGQAALAGPAVGLVSAADGLSLFNAYLTNLGRVTTLQKPVLTTTSGVPADFRRTVTRFFNSVSQQAASGGTGSAAVGTQNTLIAQDFGTILRVNPRIDVSTGLIRAQIELVQTSQTGTQNVSQAVSSGSTVQQINTPLPIVSKIIYSGEALLRDGDLIVMGGQTEDNESVNRDGITELMDNPMVGGVFGVSKRKAERNVFYFALRVAVSKR